MINSNNHIRKWYALYTRSRFEKVVAGELALKNITAYLPLVKLLRQWSDRKKWTADPLIRGYVFALLGNQEMSAAMYTPGVVDFVKFNGVPAAIPDSQIQSLRLLLESGESYETAGRFFALGERVIVTMGKLRGLTGELVQYRGRRKVLLRIEAINQVFLADVSTACIEKENHSFSMATAMG